jgi:hypothetical protein
MKKDFKWEFNTSIGKERVSKMINPPTFEEITQKISQTMNVLCGHPDECDDAYGYKRFIYCIEVDKDLFDLFFNSRNGYRAWYFRSAYAGLAKNNHFINYLLPKLIESEKIMDDPKTIQDSFNTISTKAWLSESNMHLCNKCGEWSYSNDNRAELYNDVWENTNAPNSKYGKTTPYLTKIKIFGGFVNNRGDEFIANRKKDRHKQIHLIGWS